jgi:hypothetical protein
MPGGVAQQASTAARSASQPPDVAVRWPAAEPDQLERLLPVVTVKSMVTYRYVGPRKTAPSCSTGSGASYVGDLVVIDRRGIYNVFTGTSEFRG